METPSGLPARRFAFDLLRAVLREHRPLDEALDRPGFDTLETRDRAFARLLVATVLRRLGQIDALIRHALAKPLQRDAVAVRDVLRLGLGQLLFVGTPAHAAVATSVDLVAAAGFDRHKGLVNAVLRRLGREGPALLADQDAGRLNTPDWLWDAWAGAYGKAAAHAIAAAHLAEPPLDITAKADPAGWAQSLDAELLPTGSLRRTGGGSVAELPGFAEGGWWVQDAAAAIPARLFGEVSGLGIADLCAAPGGKTAQLAAAGATVTAVDRSARRLDVLSGNLKRLDLPAGRVVADATEWRPAEPLDGVLLDAPCSATGTIRRHPDIQRLKGPDDVAKLAALQARLLDHAVTLVKPGGLIVWCTCSLQREEGEDQIERLLASGAPVRRVPVAVDEVGGLAEIVTAAGDIRTLPSHAAEPGGLDGFHISRLRREA
ncbi:MAG: RsmB/NOP family class I SAM-dependent RNA methyltransferase [Inquilinus sp.]|nr:RsmB/NOP family class I SAM-dependent RNA methyltransferase [Inquilinus sp.]